MADERTLVLPEQPQNPDLEDPILRGIYKPQRKGFFLTRMLRTLVSGPLALFHWGRGSVPHRILDAAASELEDISFETADIVRLALREGTYRAFRDPTLFPARFGEGVAQGSLTLTVALPLLDPVTLIAGTRFGSSDGRTVRLVANTVFPVNASSLQVSVVSETPGPAGNFASGQIDRVLGAPIQMLVSNPQEIRGGLSEESDDAIYTRFGDFIESRATGNRLSVYSAGKNSAAPLGDRVSDAALIYPWRIPQLNASLAYGYLVIDNGSGGASNALVARAQLAADTVISYGQEVVVLAASAFVIPLELTVTTLRNADVNAVRAALSATWNAVCGASLIEDGRGRGRVSLFDLTALFDKSHPDVVNTLVTSHNRDLQPPLGARIIAGPLTVTVRPGTL